MPPATRRNEDVVRSFVGAVNDQQYDRVAGLLTDGYDRHDPDTPGDERGPEPFVASLRRLHEAFPDGEVHVGETVAEDDLVAFEGRMTGTHEGVFRGIGPTGGAFEIPGTALHRVEDGQIAESWATWHFLGLLRQLGVTELPVE
jgi:steroid delta-isomerase-like uncharacterized protein